MSVVKFLRAMVGMMYQCPDHVSDSLTITWGILWKVSTALQLPWNFLFNLFIKTNHFEYNHLKMLLVFLFNGLFTVAQVVSARHGQCVFICSSFMVVVGDAYALNLKLNSLQC